MLLRCHNSGVMSIFKALSNAPKHHHHNRIITSSLLPSLPLYIQLSPPSAPISTIVSRRIMAHTLFASPIIAYYYYVFDITLHYSIHQS
jgi:hypothetical protein